MVYAELEDSNYTGIGISCGGGLCNVCLAYLSVPVMSFSMAKAGDYIDQSAASVTGERANRIRILKEEAFHLNGFFSDKTSQVLGVYYDEMIQSLVTAMKEAFLSTRNKPKFSPAHPDRSERWHGASRRLPGPFREAAETTGFSDPDLRNPHGKRSAAQLRKRGFGRGAHGSVGAGERHQAPLFRRTSIFRRLIF